MAAPMRKVGGNAWVVVVWVVDIGKFSFLLRFWVTGFVHCFRLLV